MKIRLKTQDEINKLLWQVSCHFRGVVDPTHHKEYILSILFLKYISDVRRGKIILPKGASFQEIYDNRFSKRLGNHINDALLAIERLNKTKLAGVFKGVDFSSEVALGKTEERNHRLIGLLEGFNQLSIDGNSLNGDVIGNSYIYLLSKFASGAGKKAGEFYTPYSVARLLAKLATPKNGDAICDPTCGSGSLLIEAAKQAIQVKLFGMEINYSAWALARINMLIYGHDQAQIKWCDTLANPALCKGNQLMQFEVVIANPPFSPKSWRKEKAGTDPFCRFWRGIPSKGDYAFISHMIEVAKPRKGRVITVGPPGLLFHAQTEGKIRKKLIEENLLDAVIALPERLFATTEISVVVLIFDRKREKKGKDEHRRDVLFIDASREYCREGSRRTLSEAHIDKIISTYRERKTIEKYAYLASPQEVKNNEFRLNVPFYVNSFVPEEPINIEQLQAEFHRIDLELSRKKLQVNQYILEGISHE